MKRTIKILACLVAITAIISIFAIPVLTVEKQQQERLQKEFARIAIIDGHDSSFPTRPPLPDPPHDVMCSMDFVYIHEDPQIRERQIHVPGHGEQSEHVLLFFSKEDFIDLYGDLSSALLTLVFFDPEACFTAEIQPDPDDLRIATTAHYLYFVG